MGIKGRERLGWFVPRAKGLAEKSRFVDELKPNGDELRFDRIAW